MTATSLVVPLVKFMRLEFSYVPSEPYRAGINITLRDAADLESPLGPRGNTSRISHKDDVNEVRDEFYIVIYTYINICMCVPYHRYF